MPRRCTLFRKFHKKCTAHLQHASEPHKSYSDCRSLFLLHLGSIQLPIPSLLDCYLQEVEQKEWGKWDARANQTILDPEKSREISSLNGERKPPYTANP